MHFFLQHRQGLRQLIVFLVMFSMVVSPVMGSRTWAASSPPGKSKPLTSQEKAELVRQGVEQYKAGNHDQARETLETARSVFPENYAAPYYLGLIYLEKGARSAAIAQWQQYVKMDPNSTNSLRIRKNLKLLLVEEARQNARLAVANEAHLKGQPSKEGTVAVSTFTNLGSDRMAPLGKGMAALLIYDLSQVPGLKLVERMQLQALIDEMKLGATGIVTPETAPRVGKLIKARHVTSGTLADLQENNLQIASTLMDADRRISVGDQEVQGELQSFFTMEKEIACQIVTDLGKDCDAVPESFHTVHTKSLAALIAFGMGLEFLDRGEYDQARESFQKALDEDPQFRLAQESLLETPVPHMQFQLDPGDTFGPSGIGTTDQMIAMAAAHGVAADMAGSATTLGSEVATGGGGIGTTMGVIAGAAVIGGAAVALGAGGGSSDDTPGGSTGGNTGGNTDVSTASQGDFVGTYQVTSPDFTYDQWHAQQTLNADGTGTYIETFEGQSYSGTLTWNFDPDADTFSFRSDGGAQFSGRATGSVTSFTLTGTWANGDPGTINFSQ
jgi:Tfp pilus assembly protein PilF